MTAVLEDAIRTRSFEYAMPAEPEGRARHVEAARRDAVAFLHGGGMPAEPLYDMELVVGEAAGNVARHSGSRVMRLTVSVADHAAGVTVEDEGCGFVPAALEEPEDLAESGRGLPMMRALSSCLVIESRPGRTVVMARKEWRP